MPGDPSTLASSKARRAKKRTAYALICRRSRSPLTWVVSKLILIENLTAETPTAGGFVRPTVIDLKLGTQMWDPDSSEEKKERMEKVSKETTTGRWGVRITGGKVRLPFLLLSFASS